MAYSVDNFDWSDDFFILINCKISDSLLFIRIGFIDRNKILTFGTIESLLRAIRYSHSLLTLIELLYTIHISHRVFHKRISFIFPSLLNLFLFEPLEILILQPTVRAIFLKPLCLQTSIEQLVLIIPKVAQVAVVCPFLNGRQSDRSLDVSLALGVFG
jgi:hypothetical protein